MPPGSKDAPQEQFVFAGGPTLNEQSDNVRSMLLRRVLSEKRTKRRQGAAVRLDSMLNKQAQGRATVLCTCGIDTEQGAVLSDLSVEATGYPLIKPRDNQHNQIVRLHGSQDRCPTCGEPVAGQHHRDILRVTSGASEPKLNSKEQLELRLLALRALQREIANVSETKSPDALVMCILFLAVNDKHNVKIARDPSPFSPPFVSLQALDLYGSRDYHLLHWNMLHDIIQRFGGIESLQAFALPWLLTLAALMRSAQILTKPIYPIVGVTGKPLDLQPPSLLFQPHGYHDPQDQAGSGFHELSTKRKRPD
ncbi:hypothetical protein BDV12DRAFT_201949 [Aspergillus spectabilis]